MKVLVTGAGLVGAHSAAALAERGHDVTLVDAAPSRSYVRSVVGDRPVAVETGDVTDFARLVALADGAGAIVHTAGLIGPVAQADPYRAFAVNAGGTVNVAEAARRSGARRLVYASTHGVYDWSADADGPMTEDWPTAPASVYAASKLNAEHALRAYADVYALEAVALRFCNLFGRGLYVAGSRGGQAFDAVVHAAASGAIVHLAPQVTARGEWLYAKDAALAVVAAVERPLPPGLTVVNVGTGRLTDADDLERAVRAVIPGARFERERAGGRERQAAFDLATARAVLGWSPSYTLESAVAEYCEASRAQDR